MTIVFEKMYSDIEENDGFFIHRLHEDRTIEEIGIINYSKELDEYVLEPSYYVLTFDELFRILVEIKELNDRDIKVVMPNVKIKSKS